MSHDREAIGAIIPKRRPWGLLIDVADEIPNLDRRRVGAGVKFPVFGCGTLTSAEILPCEDADEWEPAEDIDEDGCASFDAFVIEVAEVGTTLDYTIDDLRARHDARVAIQTSAALTAGLLGKGPMNLSTAADVATSDPGLPPLIALELIEERLAASLYGGAGIIHVTPAGLVAIAEHLERDGNLWRTPTGHVVVGDAGFTDLAPEGETSGAGEGWMYGSGPVQVAISAPHVDTFGRAESYLDRTTNKMRGWSERAALAIFDPCAVVAAKYVYDYEFYGS